MESLRDVMILWSHFILSFYFVILFLRSTLTQAHASTRKRRCRCCCCWIPPFQALHKYSSTMTTLGSSSNTYSSSLSLYSPISTLERQYAGEQRLLLFLRTNANCCLPGGVESLLKLQHKSTASISPIATTSTTSTHSSTPSADDPFAFLNDDTSNGTTTAPPLPEKKKMGIGSWAKTVAKKTSQNIERGMTGLAIRADGGKNPDVLVFSVRDANGTLLSTTEPQTLAQNDHERLQGCWFAIPLTVGVNAGHITVQLYIRSGAALAKGKHYLLGQVSLNTVSLQQSLQQQSPTLLTLPLQSQVVVDGQVFLCVTNDLKFPLLFQRGWSMTDPDLSGYAEKGLFHLPLDQSYGYSVGKQWFLATERAIESSVVLPIATAFQQLAAKASQVSLKHASSVDRSLYEYRHDCLNSPSKAMVTLTLGYLHVNTSNTNQQAVVSLHWQRPDSMFEVELAPWTPLPMSTCHEQFQASTTLPFSPPVTTPANILPTILASYGTTPPPYLLGNVRLQFRVSSSLDIASLSANCDAFGTIGTTSTSTTNDEYWQAVIPLEAYINTQPMASPIQIPVYSNSTQVATIVMQVQVAMPATVTETSSIVPSTGGLVSLVGLDTLLEDNGSLPMLDYDKRVVPTTDPALQRRQQQLYTMGPFVSHQYLQHHVSALRTPDTKLIQERSKQYQRALSYSSDQVLPSYQDKTPKPFRPSSSRLEKLLSGIPFNVHVHSLSVESSGSREEGALFHNVTCGAPADHARGFGNIISSTNGTDGANVSPVGPVSGGLRRLEAKRLELAKAVQDAQSLLITSVGAYLVEQRQRQPNQAVHYIPALYADTFAKRWKVFEATQALYHVTWTCTVRRANVFSQALGIAITSYLTAVSDVHKAAWPDLWVRHGYLITYEGLLSAAGKELGMIEDASVGIAMLRMVSVVLVADNGGALAATGERVAVPNSPYLKWVQLTPSGVGSNTQYRVEIGMDAQYYMERIPEPLKNGTSVRMYPLLFQVGVDIRQWHANQERNLKDQFSQGRIECGEMDEPVTVGGLLEDEDDDVGVTDDDVLISLNLEALRKMNAYAHTISPMGPAAANGGPADPAVPQVHPALTTLHQHIMSSAGRMNHSILDEAASIAQSLGGGGAVFCKSGKDRTAMHVTYKSAQFARRYLSNHTKDGASAEVDQKVVYDDATLMRIHGTRLPICEKNVGQAKYAFNALQVKFMPDMLKPPPSTLAGFLKGGRVFGGGAIES